MIYVDERSSPLVAWRFAVALCVVEEASQRIAGAPIVKPQAFEGAGHSSLQGRQGLEALGQGAHIRETSLQDVGCVPQTL